MNSSFINHESSDRIVAILAYHKIGRPPANGWESWFYIPEETFAGHLSYLRESGWQVIDHATFLEGLVEPPVLPRRSVFLTFDDGFRSMRQVTLPWLLEYRFPAVLFVPTDFIGGHNWFDAGEEPLEAMCDWDDLRVLERYGVSVQSHGASHRHFSELDPAGQMDELVRSKALLESMLRKCVKTFSYPYGDGGADPGVQHAMLKQAGYNAACLYKGGPLRLPAANPYRLTRIAMGPDTDLPGELERG